MSELVTSPVVPGNRVFASAPAWLWLITPSVGVLLIAAAFMKALSPDDSVDSVIANAVYDMPQWIMAAGVQIELTVGLWLVCGWRPQAARRSAIVLFFTFAAFSLYRSLSGYESCGCFGSFRVNPWLTFLLDLGVLGLLAIPCEHFSQFPVAACSRVGAWSFRFACALAAATPPVLMVLIHLRSDASASTDANEPGITVTDSLVILEPEQWIGRPFPLVKELPSTVDLQTGNWTVLFFHHDCPQCQEVLPQYEALVAKFNERENSTRVLLVEVPPYGPGRVEAHSATTIRLSDKRNWFVQTPLELFVQDGKVITASLELPAIASFRKAITR
jgi:hypothetical protein